MSTTFEKEEMIQASQFRVLSQRALKRELAEHEKLGVLFPNEGLEAVMMSYERYEALVNRLEQLEGALDDLELEKMFGHRADTPVEDWIEHLDSVSTGEMYRRRQKERTDL